eukprot:NODE_5110_length_323_cov_251.638686_g4499_i0.p1 GENE.NODE_5110_length_323_cov_251.638686_g4499_i0~~NODE_5110_length_323_cov_251.638686_g4499_i0.p1  ORF type:complete len:73 (+),score=22.09 NODE_5110_length_323_cov_251.638686_g4499_i0:31-219(+)
MGLMSDEPLFQRFAAAISRVYRDLVFETIPKAVCTAEPIPSIADAMLRDLARMEVEDPDKQI